MRKVTLLFRLVAAFKTRRFEHGRHPGYGKATSNDVGKGKMARNAPCAEAARQRVRTECVHRRSTFASMRNTDIESDAKSDAIRRELLSMKVPTLWFGTLFIQVPDSGCEAALKHARRCWLSTGTKVATVEEH